MTNKILFLSAQDVKKALPMNEAIVAMGTAFSRLSGGRANVPLRTALEMKDKDGIGLFMPAYLPGQDIISLKAVTVYKNNPAKDLPMVHALVTVFDASTGKPLAVMDGEELTAIRTGAAAGCVRPPQSDRSGPGMGARTRRTPAGSSPRRCPA